MFKRILAAGLGLAILVGAGGVALAHPNEQQASMSAWGDGFVYGYDNEADAYYEGNLAVELGFWSGFKVIKVTGGYKIEYWLKK